MGSLVKTFTKILGKWTPIPTGDFLDSFNPPYAYFRNANNYHLGVVTIPTLTTTAIAKDVIRYTPFYIAKQVTVTKIGFAVTVAGDTGSVARLGIYAATATTHYPGALIVDCGTVALDGATGTKEISISQVLDPGMYWLAINHNSTTSPTFRTHAVSFFPYFSGVSTPNGTGFPCVFTQNLTFTTMPSNASISTSSTTTTQVPAVYLLYS